jgi:hypothetical protein
MRTPAVRSFRIVKISHQLIVLPWSCALFGQWCSCCRHDDCTARSDHISSAIGLLYCQWASTQSAAQYLPFKTQQSRSPGCCNRQQFTSIHPNGSTQPRARGLRSGAPLLRERYRSLVQARNATRRATGELEWGMKRASTFVWPLLKGVRRRVRSSEGFDGTQELDGVRRD